MPDLLKVSSYITDKYGASVFLCYATKTGVTDVIFAALFTGRVWELSASVTEDGGSSLKCHSV